MIRCWVGLVLSCCATPAVAQFAGSVSIQNDDRFRGRSLSEGRPVTTLDLSYDTTAGFYLGGAVTAVSTRHEGVHVLGFEENAGYAWKTKAGPVVDLGVANASYTEYYSGGYSADYTELYAGLITGPIASHIHFSPNYFRHGVSTVYLETDGVARIARRWRLNGHVGVLVQTGGPSMPMAPRSHYDWRVGIAHQLGRFSLQASWSGGGPDRDYYDNETHSRDALVFGLTCAF